MLETVLFICLIATNTATLLAWERTAHHLHKYRTVLPRCGCGMVVAVCAHPEDVRLAGWVHTLDGCTPEAERL
jgi:hypothetical protein